MKVLNLDSLVKVDKSVKLKGVEHNVCEMSVDDFIVANQEAKRIAALKDAPDSEDKSVQELNSSIKLLNRVLPSIAEAELRGLTFSQLNALMDFVNGILEEEAGQAPVALEGEGADAKK